MKICNCSTIRNTAISLIFILIIAVSGPAQTPKAGAKTFQLGDRLIAIPAPDGFEEAASQFESIRNRFSATEDPGNDMLAVHLSIADSEKVRRGDDNSFSFYTKVSVNKAFRDRDVSDADFSDIVGRFKQSTSTLLDINSPSMKATLENLEKSLSELNKQSTNLDISEPVNLGEFDNRPNVYGLMLLLTLRMQSGETQVNRVVVGTLSFVRMKQRLIYCYTYRKYDSKADIAILRDFTKQWIGKILAAN